MEELKILQEQFQAAANNYPGMAHVVACRKLAVADYPSKKRITQKEQAKRKAIAFQAAIEAHIEIEPGYELIPEKQVDCWTSDSALGQEYFELHCLLRPQKLTWNKETARETLKSLADKIVCYVIETPILRSTLLPGILLSENHTEGWLSVVHDLGNIPKKVCEKGGRRIAEDGEPYYSVVVDVFLTSALALRELLSRWQRLPGELRQNEPITLDRFIEIACGIKERNRRKDIRNTISKAKHLQRISLPAYVGKWVSGQPKRYDPLRLFEGWKIWREEITTLPKFDPQNT